MKTTNDVTAFIKPILVIIEALVKNIKELYHYPLINLLNWHMPENITPLFYKYYNIFRELAAMLWSANKQYIIRIIDNKQGFVYFYSVFHDFELNKHKTLFIDKFKIKPTNENVRYLYDIYLSSSLGYYTLYSGENEDVNGHFYIMDNHLAFIETLFDKLYSDYEDATCEVDTLNLYDNAGAAIYTYNPKHKSGDVFHFDSEQDYIEEMQYNLRNDKFLKLISLQ